MEIEYNLENSFDNYNQTIINVVWNHKIKFIIFIIFTCIGYIYIPYFENIEKYYSLKSEKRNKYLSIYDLKERKDMFDVILDVRSKEEYTKGHLKKSLNMEYNDILNEKDLNNLKTKNITQDKIILVYCNNGNRSKKVFNHFIDTLKYNQNNIYFTNESYDVIEKAWS